MPAPKDKRTRKNLEAFFIAVQKPLLNEQIKSNVLHLFLKRHHMRDIFNNFNDFLLYFFIDFKAIPVYYCVNKKVLTHFYSTDDGITFRKAHPNFTF